MAKPMVSLRAIARLAVILPTWRMTTVALLALVSHAPRWAVAATRDMQRVRRALGSACRGIYHVGSTSVPGIAASPVVDLLAEVHSFAALQTAALRLSAHGFVAQAEQVAHRRIYHVDDLVTRQRRVELHCYESDHPEAKGRGFRIASKERKGEG